MRSTVTMKILSKKSIRVIIMRFLTFFQDFWRIENPQKVGGYERGGHDFGSIFLNTSQIAKISLESWKVTLN